MFFYLEFYDFNNHYLSPRNKKHNRGKLDLAIEVGFFLQYLPRDIAEQQLRFVKNGKKQPVTCPLSLQHISCGG